MRCKRSARFTAVARTRTRTSPRDGVGVSTSRSCRTSGPPNCVMTMARMAEDCRTGAVLSSLEVPMKKVLYASVLFAGLAFSSLAQAKCYHYDNSPSDVYVCVGKGGRDDFADRNKGQEVCSAKTG